MRKLTPPSTRSSFPVQRFCQYLDGSIAALVFCAGALAFAGSASWLFNPGSGDWNTASNWNPATIPNATADTATFATSNIASVSVTANTEVNGLVFSAGASAFIVTAQPTSTLTISGTGITNNSGITQTFATAVNGAGANGIISFTNGASAGSLTAFFNNGGTVSGLFGGSTRFFGTSTAGSGTFTSSGGTVSGAVGGSTLFINSSTAGGGTFTANGGAVSGAEGGATQFFNTSNAGTGTFIANGGAVTNAFGGSTQFFDTASASNGNFTANGGTGSGVRSGSTEFFNNSDAGNGIFLTKGGTGNLGPGASTIFHDTSTAGNGTFTTNGGTVSGGLGGDTSFLLNSKAGTGTFITNAGAVTGAIGGTVRFFNNSNAENGTFTNNGGTVGSSSQGSTVITDTSTAANATLIANAGTGGGGGGIILFSLGSTGGTATVKVFGNGSLDISPHNAPGLTIGSLEGTGVVFTGARNLTVGSNSLSKTFDGVIQDSGGTTSGTGGSLTKIGSGSLTLTGTNLYTGPTVVNVGTLLVNGSLSASSAVSVNNTATLGGTGTVGAVTVGATAFLQGGDGVAASGALKSTGPVTLGDGSVIRLTLGAASSHSSLIRTGGTWAFDPTAQQFQFNTGANAGFYFNIITGLVGSETGLSDIGNWKVNPEYVGSTFFYNFDTGAVSLNLVAVPEPGATGLLLAGLGMLGALRRHRAPQARWSLRRIG